MANLLAHKKAPGFSHRVNNIGIIAAVKARKLIHIGINALIGKYVRRIERNVYICAVCGDSYVVSAAEMSAAFCMAICVSAFAAARISDCDRSGHAVYSLIKHGFKLGKVCRTQHLHVRNRTQITDIKSAVVSFAVVSDKACSVNAENDMQVLKRNIVDEHIICALEKSRVYCDDGHKPLLCHTGSH